MPLVLSTHWRKIHQVHRYEHLPPSPRFCGRADMRASALVGERSLTGMKRLGCRCFHASGRGADHLFLIGTRLARELGRPSTPVRVSKRGSLPAAVTLLDGDGHLVTGEVILGLCLPLPGSRLTTYFLG